MRLLKAMMAMVAGSAMALGSGGVFAQAAPPAKKSAAEPTKQTPPPAKQAPAPAKKAPARKAAAPAVKPAEPAPSAGADATAAAQKDASPNMSPGNRRDPFAALVSSGRGNQKQTPEVTCRAPGKGSVVIDTMRLDGLVRSAEGMIAAVRTPQGRVYFLREGDRLCDGRVERITLDGMTLRQSSRDAFGRGIDRPVNKRLFPSVGE